MRWQPEGAFTPARRQLKSRQPTSTENWNKFSYLKPSRSCEIVPTLASWREKSYFRCKVNKLYVRSNNVQYYISKYFNYLLAYPVNPDHFHRRFAKRLLKLKFQSPFRFVSSRIIGGKPPKALAPTKGKGCKHANAHWQQLCRGTYTERHGSGGIKNEKTYLHRPSCGVEVIKSQSLQ